MIKRGFLALLLLWFPVLSGCTSVAPSPADSLAAPSFSDDLEYRNLDKAVEQSLIYLRKLPPATNLPLAGRFVEVGRLVRSLTFFRSLLRSHPSASLLKLELSTYFDIIEAPGREGLPEHTMLVTGYYQPVFEGSLTRRGPYVYPLYSVPDNLALLHEPSGQIHIGRLQGGDFLNYWTRGEIETRGYARGNELVYLKNPLDAFLLHVQGSGLIRLRNGTVRGIHYAMKNGRPYKSIGKYMVETGRMELFDASIDTIRRYINAHPGEQEEILHHNESYIFFEWIEGDGAQGNLGRELTPGRSIAVDQKIYPAGALGFLMSRKPLFREDSTVSWQPFERFVLVQDTGSAIRGTGRVDLFWGRGEQAGRAAGMMKEPGKLFFLILKKEFL